MSLVLPKRWTRQPQGPVQVDWEHPLARGLVIETGGHRLFNKRLIDGAVGQAVNTGSGVSVSHGRYGKALQFDGTQASGAASFGDIARAEGYPQSSWQIIWKSGGGKVFGKWGNPDQVWLIELTGTGTDLIWIAGTSAGFSWWSASSVFSTTEWNNAVFSWRGGANASLFVNGVDKTSSLSLLGSGGSQINGSSTAQIGVVGDGGPITGAVALARMWNRGLSAAECQSVSANPYQILKPTKAIVGAVVSAPSITRPNSDITVAGWVGDPDNVTLYNNIDEVTPSDTDFVISPSLGASPGPAVFGLTQSLAAGTYNVRARARRTGTTGQIRALLLDSSGTTVGTGSWQSLTASFVTYTLSVTTTGTAARVRLEVQ